MNPTLDGGRRSVAGAFGPRKEGKLNQISDGLSKTFMAVEVADFETNVYEARPSRHPNGPYGNRSVTGLESGQGWLHHEKGSDHTFYSSLAVNMMNSKGVYAFHDGANTLMCDASVALRSPDTDPNVMLTLWSRAGAAREFMNLKNVQDSIIGAK